jgi:hypothetical protein
MMFDDVCSCLVAVYRWSGMFQQIAGEDFRASARSQAAARLVQWICLMSEPKPIHIFGYDQANRWTKLARHARMQA